MQKHPGAINTGIQELDGTLSVLLGTTILVGGFLGCFLDNIIPGTKEERGLTAWEKEMSLESDTTSDVYEKSTYDFPYGMSILRRYATFNFVKLLRCVNFLFTQTYLDGSGPHMFRFYPPINLYLRLINRNVLSNSKFISRK